jgi:large subunit ribosomal protein L21
LGPSCHYPAPSRQVRLRGLCGIPPKAGFRVHDRPIRGALSKGGGDPGNAWQQGPQDAENVREDKMFAVLKTGGKQYKVTAGDVLRVEKLQADAGDTIQFNDILMVGDQVGAPMVAGAAVQATVIDQIKGEKTIHFVRRRRKHSSKRTKGHRQQLTLVRITDVLATGADTTGVKAAIGTAAARRDAHNNAPAPVVEAAPVKKPRKAAAAKE